MVKNWELKKIIISTKASSVLGTHDKWYLPTLMLAPCCPDYRCRTTPDPYCIRCIIINPIYRMFCHVLAEDVTRTHYISLKERLLLSRSASNLKL